MLPSLVIPVCLGLTMYLGLSYMIAEQQITSETVLRYLTGHPVSKVTVAMFFIGLASLLMIAFNVFGQFSSHKDITLDVGDEDERQRIGILTAKEHAVELGKHLGKSPKHQQTHYLWQRLQNTLHSVYRNGSTRDVEDELKYQSELDLDQQQQRYSLVRILIWATPMLGFLGTVLGISQALGGINVGAGNNFQTMMDGLRGSLYIAFDTTALALTLSMLLMFGQFLVDRFESQLLLLVDQRAKSEVNRNLVLPIQNNGILLDDGSDSLGSISSRIEAATLHAGEKQTEIWRKTIQAAQEAWASTLTEANMRVHSSMSDAIDDNVANLAHYLGESIEKADLAMSHRWQQWQVTLSENARLLHQHHAQLAEQTVLLHDLMDKAAAQAKITSEVPVVETTQVDSLETDTPESSAKKPRPVLDLQVQANRKPLNSKPRRDKAPEPTTPVVATKPKLPQVILKESIKVVPPKSDTSEESEKEIFDSTEQPTQTDDDQGPVLINFQAYVNSKLEKSSKAEASKQRASNPEIILPFKISEQQSSDGQQQTPDQSYFGTLKKSA